VCVGVCARVCVCVLCVYLCVVCVCARVCVLQPLSEQDQWCIAFVVERMFS
jgi:hypothetical protein